MDAHALEVARGERFAFGANWARFLKQLDGERIAAAERSLQTMLEVERLDGKRFLDIGSGSGLFSLAARRLGATVHSFDYDPQSVACTRELRRRFRNGDKGWTVEQGSALDHGYLQSLGEFDIVYSWGVLHHTGQMWDALQKAGERVAPGGTLFIAIYDDQEGQSRRWTKVKKAYCNASKPVRALILGLCFLYCWGRTMVIDVLKGRPFHTWRHYGEGSARGMSPWRDLVDWVGGYPFEVAKPGEILDFYRARGFALDKLTTSVGGCNEFVFTRR
jgi:2-polyprenyl-6-hydroxyphenyl methylase/3-demethylubiquinone-9 3-methyltransferase